jgi:hypothetical protein
MYSFPLTRFQHESLHDDAIILKQRFTLDVRILLLAVSVSEHKYSEYHSYNTHLRFLPMSDRTVLLWVMSASTKLYHPKP